MESNIMNWLRILDNISSSDYVGHETWCIVGCEQHGDFYYCAIGNSVMKPEYVVGCILGYRYGSSVELDEEIYEYIKKVNNADNIDLYIGISNISIEHAIERSLLKVFSCKSKEYGLL